VNSEPLSTTIVPGKPCMSASSSRNGSP
jgi:hypothetical protein